MLHSVFRLRVSAQQAHGRNQCFAGQPDSRQTSKKRNHDDRANLLFSSGNHFHHPAAPLPQNESV